MNNPETINPKLVNPDPKGSLITTLARNMINPITQPIIASISLCLKVSSLTLNTDVWKGDPPEGPCGLSWSDFSPQFWQNGIILNFFFNRVDIKIYDFEKGRLFIII